MKLISVFLCALCGASLAAEKPAKAKGGIGADAPAGKPYIYKESAGSPARWRSTFRPITILRSRRRRA
jgi:hypothetical protein